MDVRHITLALLAWLALALPAAAQNPPLPALPQLSQAGTVTLYQSAYWRLVRHYPSGIVDLFAREASKSPQRLTLPLEWRRNTYPMLVLEDDGTLYVIGYDVVANLPSGRRLEEVRNGFDLYRFKPGQTDAPKLLASNLQLGGIDTVLTGAAHDGRVDLCGNNRCLSVKGRKVRPWDLADLAPYEFVELAFDGDRVAALLRWQPNEEAKQLFPPKQPIYKLAIFARRGARLLPIPQDGVPWRLHWQGGKPHISLARTPADLRALFFYDLARKPFGGIMEFGSNNLEGRIAWAQVYYLNGLISALSEAALGWNQEQMSWLKARVSRELRLTAQLTDTLYPGLQAKRYSLDREPVLIALHLSRVARLLIRAQTAGVITPSGAEAISRLQGELETLQNTLEQSSETSGFEYMQFRKGYPFWADGVIVPYNFVSDYVSALMAMSNATPPWPDHWRNLLRPLLTQEFQEPYPRSWRYWWGVGDQGWREANSPSLNTPVWKGNAKAPAHITYRSMDAMALIALARKQKDTVPSALIDHFAALVSQGWLLPHVNEELSLSEKTAVLKPDIARYYARSTAAWGIQSQIWALHQLGKPHD